jgi:hypothetical protein
LLIGENDDFIRKNTDFGSIWWIAGNISGVSELDGIDLVGKLESDNVLSSLAIRHNPEVVQLLRIVDNLSWAQIIKSEISLLELSDVSASVTVLREEFGNLDSVLEGNDCIEVSLQSVDLSGV